MSSRSTNTGHRNRINDDNHTYRPELGLDAGTGSANAPCNWYIWNRNMNSPRHSHSRSDGRSKGNKNIHGKSFFFSTDRSCRFTAPCEADLLLPNIPQAANKCQIETHTEAVLEEERGSATVELSFGDDGDAVAQQIRLVHVVSGQNHCTTCMNVLVLACH